MKKPLKTLSLISTFLIFCSQEVYAAASKHAHTGHPTLIKFFSAMFGVLVSILVIWLSLILYKKFMLKNNSKLDNVDYDKTLESPKDFKEAINLFLDKTDR